MSKEARRHVCFRAARCRRPSSVAGHFAWPPLWPPSTQRRPSISGRSADRRRSHRRHAECWRIAGRPPRSSADRDPMARRAADQRGARTRRKRPRPHDRRCARAPRQGRQAPRGRHGPLGLAAARPLAEHRPSLPVGALLCVMHGPTAGRPWSPSAARTTLRDLAVMAGVRRRFAPHQLRHAHAVEMAREGVPLTVVQRQLVTRTLSHVRLPARHRQQRDRQHRLRTAGADAARKRGTQLSVAAGPRPRRARRACRWCLTAVAVCPGSLG
jgi:hypothetical protein